jgi:hypothetical protein
MIYLLFISMTLEPAGVANFEQRDRSCQSKTNALCIVNVHIQHS